MKDTNFESVILAQQFNILIKSKHPFNLIVTKELTGNCQLWSIGNFHYLLAKPYCTGINVGEAIKRCWTSVNKNLLLIDVRQSPYVELIDKMIPSNLIISKVPYTSTNGSSMCIYLINTKEGKVFDQIKPIE